MIKPLFRISSVALLSISMLAACGADKNNAAITPAEQKASAPIEVKVVIVSMFEIGEDSGDTPGEFQFWKERQKLDTRFAFPQSHHDIYMNLDTGVMGIVTGMGTAKSTAAVMALGLDPRFDFSHAYWLVAGIAGVDPNDASLASGVWAEWLVDGDLAHEIDAREMPKEWKTGYFPLFAVEPYQARDSADNHHVNAGEVYHLNAELADWAYNLSKHVELVDNEGMQAMRAKYVNYPNAQKPPFILKGDQLAAMTFWHGKLMNDWANDWTEYWTDGKGNFVTSAMEDTGTYLSLLYLTQAKKADVNRLMVLRTASNFSMQPQGVTAAENLAAESKGYAGFVPSLETAYRAGSVVVNDLVSHWDRNKTQMPYATE